MIGTLDRKIVIEQCTETQNVYGEKTEAWSTLATVFAKALFGNNREGGKETTEANQITAVSLVKFTIRYRSDVTTKMRVLWNAKYYNIKVINLLDRNGYLDLVTEQRDYETESSFSSNWVEINWVDPGWVD